MDCAFFLPSISSTGIWPKGVVGLTSGHFSLDSLTSSNSLPAYVKMSLSTSARPLRSK
ncbi:glutathione S-transferase 7 [Biomphalaria pfeifferi]|uniref:Glutathione S-transferase 7 n=1 Tax=Biomphalaria pfeifferi TaxID=112525 RepID=A0AAD8FDG7_BIOPF|nr:glutathione S-transferase 7 [Biomphalaria pfeifferi]